MTESTLAVSMPNPEERQSDLSQGTIKRKDHALKIVNKYVLVSGGIGLIPAPFFGQVAIAALLAKMLNDLCQVYNTKLSEHKSKAIVASVLGGAHSDWITYYLTNFFNKIVPTMNMVGGVVVRPLISGTITYAIGRLFIHHFESGAWLK